MNIITGMEALVINVYKKHGAVLFEGVVQLKLFTEFFKKKM